MPKIITSDELQRWMNVGRSFVLVDVLSSESYRRIHLPTAVNISAKESVFHDKVRELVGNTDTTIVIYGDRKSVDASYIAGIKLSHAGFEDVYEFKGGLNEWKEMGLPTESSIIRTDFVNKTCHLI